MSDKKQYRYLNSLLVNKKFSNKSFNDLLRADAQILEFKVNQEFDIDGILFVKNQEERRPRWAELIDNIVGDRIEQISNKSSSAVLLLRVSGSVVAFTFGYGRFLLNSGFFQQDFGIKTALNTLDHQSLRSVNLHTLEDQPIQKKTQTARGSEASVFGVDIFRDVLRAVTGSARSNIPYKNISGGDAIYSFGQEMQVEDFPKLASQLIDYYELDHYKDSFGWVDNIRRIKDETSLKKLNQSLLRAVKKKDPNIEITLPEIIKWDEVVGFSFTRSKRELTPTIEATTYLSNIDVKSVTIDSIRNDRLFLTDIHDNEFNYSVYSCLYFEINPTKSATNVLFGGNWYEIEKSFKASIESTLKSIQVTDIRFPSIHIWEGEAKKNGKTITTEKIETEADYNKRAAELLGYHLLDRKLVKSTKTTTSIELCDILTQDKQLVHVKHRKGGSAGLSHLFAQGSVSAELILGDQNFRKEARKVLKKVNKMAIDLIPINGLKSNDYEVVFLILGDNGASVKTNLPFFSKVNLSRAFENLTQRGFSVKIGGAEKVERDNR